MVRPVFFALILLALLIPAGLARSEDAPPPAAAEEAAEKPGDQNADQKAASSPAPAAEEIPKELKEHQKAAEEVFNMTKKIVEGLGPEEQKHFFLLYNNYNLVGTVKMVQTDVTNAVTACGKENPDMKEALIGRLKDWNDAIGNVIKEAEGNINNMVVAQEYAKPAEIKKVFKGLDKTRDLANAQIEKTPVSTREACEYLQNQMNDTQKNFIALLQGTLMSVPQAIPGSEPAPSPEEKKADEKKEPEKAPEGKPPGDSDAKKD